MLVIDWSVLSPLVQLSNTRCKLLGRRCPPSKSEDQLQNAHLFFGSIHCARVCAVRCPTTSVKSGWRLDGAAADCGDKKKRHSLQSGLGTFTTQNNVRIERCVGTSSVHNDVQRPSMHHMPLVWQFSLTLCVLSM